MIIFQLSKTLQNSKMLYDNNSDKLLCNCCAIIVQLLLHSNTTSVLLLQNWIDLIMLLFFHSFFKLFLTTTVVDFKAIKYAITIVIVLKSAKLYKLARGELLYTECRLLLACSQRAR